MCFYLGAHCDHILPRSHNQITIYTLYYYICVLTFTAHLFVIKILIHSHGKKKNKFNTPGIFFCLDYLAITTLFKSYMCMYGLCVTNIINLNWIASTFKSLHLSNFLIPCNHFSKLDNSLVFFTEWNIII